MQFIRTYVHGLVISTIWIISISEAGIKLPRNVTVPAVFGFGDSIVDQGNNNYVSTPAKCLYPPYGKDFMGGLPSGRFTNGKTPIDIMAEELGIKEVVPAYLDPNIRDKDLVTGVSFASGASGYDPLTPTILAAISLSSQLNMFKDYVTKLRRVAGKATSSNILSNSLFLVVAGSVDFSSAYYISGIRKAQYDVPSYADLLVAYASSFLQEIHQVGARRIVVFGAPPIGCVPYMRENYGGEAKTCAEDQNKAVLLYNKQLSSMLTSLSHNLTNSKLVYINIYNPLLNIIHNPHKFGIDVVDKSCCTTNQMPLAPPPTRISCIPYGNTCPDDSKYLFWDTFHPTETGYRAVVDQILQDQINNLF